MNPVSYLLPLAYKALETTKTRMAVVMSLRENVSLMYPSFARWSPFQDCCVINKRKLIYNYQYKAFASILEMCYEAPPWYPRDPDRLYPPVDLRRVFMQNKRQDQRLYWQFFASESGLFTVFPATLTDLRKHCHYDDPRLKRWYTDVIAPPKDFVLLVDKSADMAEKLSTAKDVAKLLIRTANSRDSISVFGFSGGKITDPEMTDFHLVSPFTTATPSVQRELMRFVDTLTPEGDSVYRGGIIEALSRLSSQDSSERHSSRVVVIVSGAECVDSKKDVLTVIDKELTTRNMTAQFITFNVDGSLQVRDLMLGIASKGIRSCHVMPRIRLRHRMWKVLRRRSWHMYVVHDSLP
ncbi:VWFA and cache domain-containing protein 1 [Lamellibrachia satsuma]|nr:VWFA and cache domain-containing protein 1 [Lamellibrachia satsuma]